MNNVKGLILAGGKGTRLYPITLGVSKQILPIYDKPMIYYPLSVLMLAGISDIAIITTPHDQSMFKRLLGDGSQWGMSLSYIVQDEPEGLAHAYVLAEEFLAGCPSALVLGDNIFYGDGLSGLLAKAVSFGNGGTIFGYHVSDPKRYGVLSLDEHGNALKITEKPSKPDSNFAVTGLYFLDGNAPKLAKSLEPSARGELEITDLLQLYLNAGSLDVNLMGRGFAWFDTGTHSSLLEAGNFVRVLERRQGVIIGSPDEIAFDKNWIDKNGLRQQAEFLGKSPYGEYLLKRVQEAQDKS